jgi:DNA-directed RNA polymerase specialized sigma24 family protein
MEPPVPGADSTHEANLANWSTFCAAYYESILRTLRLLRVPEDEISELAHSFLIKAAEKNYVETYRSFQEREALAGRRARFRTYLYRSLQNHVCDFHRKPTPRVLEPGETGAIEARDEPTLDPDALYALDVLHQALQALRRHCERTGRSHFWEFFEETLLADEFRGRRSKTRAKLLEAFPGANSQYFDNALTTAKRAFRRFVQEIILHGPGEDATPAERFEEWMEILRTSNASQFDLLHLAYRVTPHLAPDMSQTKSATLAIIDRTDYAEGQGDEEPLPAPNDDELSILLSFRLELPLTQMLEAAELQTFIASSSPLWPIPQASGRHGVGAGAALNGPARPLCLLTLVEPTPAEAEALAESDLIGLLTRLKSYAKQLHHRPDHALPEVFSQLFYTLVNVLAVVRFGINLHSIGAESLARNVRWFLEQPWLDDRLHPLFLAGLTVLENQQ